MRRFVNSWHIVSLGLAVLTGLLALFTTPAFSFGAIISLRRCGASSYFGFHSARRCIGTSAVSRVTSCRRSRHTALLMREDTTFDLNAAFL